MADRYKITKNDSEEEIQESPDILDGGMTWFDNQVAKPVPHQCVFFQVEDKFFWGEYKYPVRKWYPVSGVGEYRCIRDQEVSCWAPLPIIGGIENKEARHYALLAQESYKKLVREYFEKIISSYDIIDVIKDKKSKKVRATEMLDDPEEDWEEDDSPVSHQTARLTRSVSEEDDFFDRLLSDSR